MPKIKKNPKPFTTTKNQFITHALFEGKEKYFNVFFTEYGAA